MRNQPLELLPLPLGFGTRPLPGADDDADPGAARVDVLLERTAPGSRPEGSDEPERSRHAIRLYEEAVALVVPAGHELADQRGIAPDDLQLVTLLDHADHSPQWPAAEPWTDPSWTPRDPVAALELVATGAGAILLPLPLARHLTRKRAHAVVPIDGAGSDAPLSGSEVWASWDVERDGNDVQRLVGIMRGRTSRSSR